MNGLNYERQMNIKNYELDFLRSKEYRITSLYDQPQIRNLFLELKANVVDLNPAFVTK